jgi:hypothetical protein
LADVYCRTNQRREVACIHVPMLEMKAPMRKYLKLRKASAFLPCRVLYDVSDGMKTVLSVCTFYRKEVRAPDCAILDGRTCTIREVT